MQQPRNLIIAAVLIATVIGGVLIYRSSQSNDETSSRDTLPQATAMLTATPNPETIAAMETISHLHANTFTDYIRDNDADSLEDLYLYRNLPLRITRKTQQGPYTSTDNISLWMGSTVARIPDYEIIVGEPFVWVDSGIGLSVAEFDELRGENHLAYGTELFSYVNTSDGWKIVALTAVRTTASDPTDYSQARTLRNDIETIFNDLAVNIADQNRGRFLVPFVAQSDPFVIVDGMMETEFTVSEDSPPAFFDHYIAEASAPQLLTEHVEVQIFDHYVAYAVADYVLMDGDAVVLRGRWLSTFYATANYGWQITSTLLTMDALTS
jgi:hypothetical protein